MKCSKTLIIGIGSTGQHVCEKVALNLNSKYGDYKNALWVGIKILETASKSSVIDKNDFISLNIEPDRFEEYRKDSKYIGSNFDWSKWGVPNAIGEHMKNGAGNRRILGRLALYHNYDEVSNTIKSEITRLSGVNPVVLRDKINIDDKEELELDNDIDVYVIGSLCGGTASGSCIDLGYLISEVWGKGTDIKTTVGIFVLPHWTHNDSVYKKNAYYALQELNHYMLNSSVWEQKLPGTAAYTNRRPYQLTYLTIPSDNTGKAFENIKSEIASFLMTACTEPGITIKEALSDAYRTVEQDKELGYLKPAFSCFGIASLEYPGEHISRMCKEKILQKLYGSWKDDPKTKDIIKDRNDLFDEHPRKILSNFSDDTIISKYEKIIEELLLDSKKFSKNSSIHDDMDVIFENVKKKIESDTDISKNAQKWFDKFSDNIKQKFLELVDKKLCSLDGGPGYLSRILKKGKEDIETWTVEQTGEIDNAISEAKKSKDRARKNIKTLAEAYVNIDNKGLFGLFSNKQQEKDAWNQVVTKSVSYAENLIKLVITEKLKTFFDSMSNGSNTIQNKYNNFVSKYTKKLDNFEVAIGAMYSFHKAEFDENKNKIPEISGEIIALKNNSILEDIEDIYTYILKGNNDAQNINIDDIEKQKAQSLLDNDIRQELLSRFKDTNFFETKQTLDSNPKDYFPNDLKKDIDIKANELFANEKLAEQRNVISSISQSPNDKINAIWDKAKTTLDVRNALIPEQFQNDDSLEDIALKIQDYAFYPASTEGTSAKKENIKKIKDILVNKVGNDNRIADNKDPYRITVLRTKHGFSLAHIKGILREDENDHANLQDSIKFNGDGLNFWNTRKDEDWVNIIPSSKSLNVIRRYWLVFLLFGNYKDKDGNWAILDKNGKPDPWYVTDNGEIIFDLHGENINKDQEYIDMDFDKAIKQIALDSEKEKNIRITCERRISAYIRQIGKDEFIKILFGTLCQNGNVYTYNIGIDEKQAEKYSKEYCLEHNLVKEYTDYQFPEDKEIPTQEFDYLYREKGYNGDDKIYNRNGYYCANKKEPHCVAHADPDNYEQQQNALRNMINAGFICPKCKGSIRRYWPYDKGNK